MIRYRICQNIGNKYMFIANANTTMIMEILSKITFPVMLILALAALFLSVISSIKIFNGKEL